MSTFNMRMIERLLSEFSTLANVNGRKRLTNVCLLVHQTISRTCNLSSTPTLNLRAIERFLDGCSTLTSVVRRKHLITCIYT